jgi:hypothetical protein
MSNPSTPAIPAETPGIDIFVRFIILFNFLGRLSRARSNRRRRRSVSAERPQSAVIYPASPLPPLTARRRPQSIAHGDIIAPTPIQLTDGVQQQVSIFVEDNFDIETSKNKKTSKYTKANRSIGQLSARTDFSSWKTPLTSVPSPFDDPEQKQTPTNPKIAFT